MANSPSGSTSIYSPLTDRCLITVARLLGRPELLVPVRRNLEMTLHYVHADGEVATEGSRRQDQYRVGSSAPYYYPYRYLALEDGNGRFAAMAESIEATAIHRLTRDAVFFCEDEKLGRPLPASKPLPTNFAKQYTHSNLVRIRRSQWSATILAENPTFFSLHKGSAAVVVRMASAFFGKGQFEGDRLRAGPNGWSMRQGLKGPYYQPFPENRRPQAKGNWAKLPRTDRPQSEVQRSKSQVRVVRTRQRFRAAPRDRRNQGSPRSRRARLSPRRQPRRRPASSR